MPELRLDLALVAEQVPEGSRVLDLGCGTGSLLSYLQQERGCSVTGVEIDPEKVLGAIRRGVPVIESDVETVTPAFADRSYDVAVLSRTLQSMLDPEHVLREMSRIATGHRVHAEFRLLPEPHPVDARTNAQIPGTPVRLVQLAQPSLHDVGGA